MSNRTKHAPASPEEERAQLRQLTRELHEAAQDARDAARELREALALVDKTAEETIVRVITPLCADVTEGVNKMLPAIQERVDFEVDHLEQVATMCVDKVKELEDTTLARLTGFEDLPQAQAYISGVIHEGVAKLAADQEFVADVASHLNPRVKFLNAAPVPITVATREMLDEFIAAGGDPGIVIDAR